MNKDTKNSKEKMNFKTIGVSASTDVLHRKIWKKDRGIGMMWQVANGEDNEPVVQRGDHISPSGYDSLITLVKRFTIKLYNISFFLFFQPFFTSLHQKPIWFIRSAKETYQWSRFGNISKHNFLQSLLVFE